MVAGVERMENPEAFAAPRWRMRHSGLRSARLGETGFFLVIVLGQFMASLVFGADERIIEGAKREGKVVWYTVAGESLELARAFEKKYPFVKVEVVRSTVFPLLSRMLNEARAGNHYYDVVRQSAFTMQVLIQKGMIQPYESSERKFYSLESKDKLAYWTSTDENYFVIGYNNRMVSSREAPRDWEDLLNSKWRGKIGLDPDNHLLYGGLEQRWGKEKAEEYFKKLSRQQIQFRKGNTLLAQLIVAGEYPLGFVYAHRVELLKAQGAPIEWVSTMNPIVATLGPVGLATKAQHPNAGKLLVDFILSADAQTQLQKMYRIPSRSNLEPISQSLDPAHLKIMPLPPSSADREDSWRKFFRSVFELPG
jgi:iron(III) transport system substrate-binding protein